MSLYSVVWSQKSSKDLDHFQTLTAFRGAEVQLVIMLMFPLMDTHALCPGHQPSSRSTTEHLPGPQAASSRTGFLIHRQSICPIHGLRAQTLIRSKAPPTIKALEAKLTIRGFLSRMRTPRQENTKVTH